MADNQKKPRDINQVIRVLTGMFNRVTGALPYAKRSKRGPNELYRYQTEFAYILNELTQSHASMQPVYIAQANELIDQILQKHAKAK